MKVVATPRLFSKGSIRNINHTKSKTKENLNILTSHTQNTHTHTHTHKLKYIRFHILKSLHDIFIINPMIYTSFNIHIQAIIHPLISYLID